MARHLHPVERQAETGARLSIRFGDNGELDASITTAGLLAIGALVAGALLGSAAIVLAARRYGPTSAIDTRN